MLACTRIRAVHGFKTAGLPRIPVAFVRCSHLVGARCRSALCYMINLHVFAAVSLAELSMRQVQRLHRMSPGPTQAPQRHRRRIAGSSMDIRAGVARNQHMALGVSIVAPEGGPTCRQPVESVGGQSSYKGAKSSQ